MIASTAPGEFTEGERLDFLDEQDGCGAERPEEGAEVLSFGPVQVWREEDRAGVLIDDSGGADEDAPEFSGEVLAGDGLELGGPTGGSGGGVELDFPAVIFPKSQGLNAGPGVSDAELHKEEPRAGFVQPQQLAGAADARGALRGLNRLQDSLVNEAVDDLASGDRARSHGLGQFSSAKRRERASDIGRSRSGGSRNRKVEGVAAVFIKLFILWKRLIVKSFCNFPRPLFDRCKETRLALELTLTLSHPFNKLYL